MKALGKTLTRTDPRITYRGESPSRLDNLTDAVFGIAITLLLFNISNPNSFTDLLSLTKTFPAFLISIGFLILIWAEHSNFTLIYSLNDKIFKLINTFFIALIIFYVYPLRFLSLILTSAFFDINIPISITSKNVPELMIYYGFVAFALYVTLYLFYRRALVIKTKLDLNDYEIFLTREMMKRMIIMFSVPMISIIVAFVFKGSSIFLASFLSGMAYCIYVPSIMIWSKSLRRFEKNYVKQN